MRNWSPGQDLMSLSVKVQLSNRFNCFSIVQVSQVQMYYLPFLTRAQSCFFCALKQQVFFMAADFYKKVV
jgi:hypothetical protein